MLEQVLPKNFLIFSQRKSRSKFANLFNKQAEKHQVSAFTDAAAAGSGISYSGGRSRSRMARSGSPEHRRRLTQGDLPGRRRPSERVR